MPRIFSFRVSPKLPARLEALNKLSLNLRWSWDHPTRDMFESVNPDLWEETNHNPRLVLGRTSQRRLAELASDEVFLAELDRVDASLTEYLSGKGWFGHAHPEAAGFVFAYFSAEFGLTECMPNYAGGLGILAGDHLKSASDAGVPLVGVSLLYQRGYFQQYLNADGWQQETYPVNDFSTLPLVAEMDAQNNPLAISVEFPGRLAYARVWKVQVGRVPLYLLDTNVPQNSEEDRRITGSLYGGDGELRLQQEMILGIGGMRVLAALGIRPAVCHMNEGHSAFLGLERTRALMEELGVTFFEARQLAAAGSLFTTHTPVAAGFDRFDPQVMARYFGSFAERLGIPFERLLSYGRQNPTDPNESFNMAFLAARISSAANGVSRLHGLVTRKMVQAMWPGYSLEEIPVDSVTNGVHIRSWVSLEMTGLLNRYLGHRWAEEPSESGVWDHIDRIPDHELWCVWLNTPRRPNEASGTSGMKLLPNGGLNLSVLDGWWAEGYDRELGWAIGRGEDYDNDDYQDAVESDALFNLLETDVAPLFYERDRENLPRRWIAKMKTSMKRLCPVFNTNRMVTEYVERFYIPAAKRYSELAAQGGARLGPIVEWRKRFRTAGSQVKITRIEAENSREIRLGEKMRVTASVVFGEIPPDYVRVQIVSGSVNGAGMIVNSSSSDMKHVGTAENEHQYEGQLDCLESGSHGFSVRVIPYHPDVRVPFEHPWLVWAE